MQQTFQVKPFDRYISLVMLAICLPLLIAVPWMISERTKPENIWVGLLVCGTLFGLLTLSAIHAVLHNWRTFLTIDEEQISLQGILRLRTFKLSEIIKVDWGIGTVFRLETPHTRCSIRLNDFTAEEKTMMVSYFHYRLSESIQENWGKYCVRASALKKNIELLDKPPDGYAILTRRHIDRLFIPFLLGILLIGIVMAFKHGKWEPLLAPVALAPLWGLLRSLIPRKGLLSRSTKARRGEKAFLWSLLLFALFGITGIIVLHKIAGNPLKQWLSLGVLFLSFLPVLYFGFRMGKPPSPLNGIDEAAAITEWEELNPPPSQL